ncbi:hypothetical protein GGR50DRAFT_686399 [Xylaria sp. CBS 124048]|nr:hypothetical protein GGR50DRAFT_686399 [Xylaria sp. CBS 124048]
MCSEQSESESQQHQQHQHQPQPHQQLPLQPPHQYADQSACLANINTTNNDHNNTLHPTAYPAVQPSSRSTFNGFPPYAAIPGGTLVDHAPQEQDTHPTGSTAQSHKPTRDSGLEASSQQKHGLATPATALSAGGSSYQSDMRYIGGQVDTLSTEQYGDGRFATKRGLFKSEPDIITAANTAPNPKKRGRKVSPDERDEPVEETKRARGRPRLETGAHQDMKERRKEQIRLAQRAYRNRKETAIVELEAKVSALEANNVEVKAAFQSLLMEFVDNHAISAQIPELGRRMQQFQALLAQRTPDDAVSQSDTVMSQGDMPVENALQMDHALPNGKMADNNQPPSQALVTTGMQQPQKLFGGIIVTYEPECQNPAQESVSSVGSALDGNYTFVKMPNMENASFVFDLSFLDNTHPSQWSLPQWELPVPASGAYLERMLSRRLHRRTTEKAASLLAMESPPYDKMHRVFGFVRNYATLDSIRQRLRNTLNRNADQDLDEYTQPFHHVGGAGTHFSGDEKNGAPFPNSGFGMGPFNEKTTAVRDELLDILQRSTFPGWQGEWFDSYDVEKFLVQRSIRLPPGGDGYVEIPPGDFYHNPLEEQASQPKDGLDRLVPKKNMSDFNVSSHVADAIPAHTTQHTMAHNSLSPLSSSSMDSMLSVPGSVDVWMPGSMPPDFLGASMTMPGNMSSLPAYDNSGLGLSNPPNYVYQTHIINPMGGQIRTKRVWFSVERFIERLCTKSTCVGRGPAFRKSDVIVSFWEAVRPGPE